MACKACGPREINGEYVDTVCVNCYIENELKNGYYDGLGYATDDRQKDLISLIVEIANRVADKKIEEYIESTKNETTKNN